MAGGGGGLLRLQRKSEGRTKGHDQAQESWRCWTLLGLNKSWSFNTKRILSASLPLWFGPDNPSYRMVTSNPRSHSCCMSCVCRQGALLHFGLTSAGLMALPPSGTSLEVRAGSEKALRNVHRLMSAFSWRGHASLPHDVPGCACPLRSSAVPQCGWRGEELGVLMSTRTAYPLPYSASETGKP